MALALEIDHLLGVSFAALGPDSAAPDWPPQPDRVFSALVSAWAARGGLAEEREALVWLERQPAPVVVASGYHARPALDVFVPPNDPRASDISILPERRRRQPRRFPAAIPEKPVASLIWAQDPPEAVLRHLQSLARDVAYVGHSASLTRCAFANSEPNDAGDPVTRTLYPGRLSELERAFARGARPARGTVVRTAEKARASARPRSLFGQEWLRLAIVDGVADARATPLFCKAIFALLKEKFDGAGPLEIVGHEADGAVARAPHMAAVPLLNVGFEHSDGGLMGFGLIPPDGSDALKTAAFVAALRRWRAGGFKLWVEGHPLTLTLAFADDDPRASLAPGRYVKPSKVWATATPMVLDRHLKAGDPKSLREEKEALIKAACRNIGLPDPEAVAFGKHSAVGGAVSAAPSGNAPRWTRWAVPSAFASRPLTHAVLEFEVEVEGPVLLGAGRFCGLGLCLPLATADDR